VFSARSERPADGSQILCVFCVVRGKRTHQKTHIFYRLERSPEIFHCPAIRDLSGVPFSRREPVAGRSVRVSR
jgi:hypothetical protein